MGLQEGDEIPQVAGLELVHECDHLRMRVQLLLLLRLLPSARCQLCACFAHQGQQEAQGQAAGLGLKHECADLRKGGQLLLLLGFLLAAQCQLVPCPAPVGQQDAQGQEYPVQSGVLVVDCLQGSQLGKQTALVPQSEQGLLLEWRASSLRAGH